MTSEDLHCKPNRAASKLSFAKERFESLLYHCRLTEFNRPQCLGYNAFAFQTQLLDANKPA
jgi:hypothetical protein